MLDEPDIRREEPAEAESRMLQYRLSFHRERQATTSELRDVQSAEPGYRGIESEGRAIPATSSRAENQKFGETVQRPHSLGNL